MNNKKLSLAAVATAISLLANQSAFAQKKYDTGASDTEIKLGNVEAYSGPASAYGVIGKIEDAYFKMINDSGGVNGRKINFISYDDGYSPPKTVEQVRKLIESDEVFLIFNAGHADPECGAEISEHQEGAAALPRHRRQQVERPEGLSLDHGLPAELPRRSADLREVHPQREARRQGRGVLPE
jgi:hypothetical protein